MNDVRVSRLTILFQAVVLFLAGLHRHAIARTTDVIKSLPNKLSYYSVVQVVCCATVHRETFCSYHLQGHMSVLLAEAAIQSHDYDRAIQLLASTTDPGEFSQVPELLTVSLVRPISRSSVRVLNA